MKNKDKIPYVKRTVQSSKKLRPCSNEVFDFKGHKKLLNLIPCEIDREDEEVQRPLLQKKSTIKDDIRMLLRMVAETNKNNQQNLSPKGLNRDYQNHSEIIITMKDVLSQSQADCDCY